MTKPPFVLVRAALTLIALGACSSDPGVPDAGDGLSHWAYEGVDGPEHWAELSAEYATCGTGKKQSPIDISGTSNPASLEGLEFSYAAAPATIVDNGHTVQVSFTGGANSVHLDGKDFKLVQFHFHAHSEHTIGGAAQPLELHLVHKADDGGLAVVGVLFKVGAKNTALAEVFDAMASASTTAGVLATPIDPASLLPVTRMGWVYSGSLTTPPCSEAVKWHVYSTVLEVSAEQLAMFTGKHDASFRPTQGLNSRIVGAGDLPHWTYESEEGPDQWGTLSPGTAACGEGHHQSPIDISASIIPAPLAGVTLSYAAAPVAIFDNGHTVQVNFTGGNNQIIENGKAYKLLQFHFHRHSEHTVGGVSHPLEVHLVHRAADGELAVLGMFYDVGATNPTLQQVFDKMSAANDVPAGLPLDFDPATLVPGAKDGWIYDGSLTTPPCSEGVKWHVYATPLQVSAAELAAFTHDPSSRPVQPLNQRTVAGGN